MRYLRFSARLPTRELVLDLSSHSLNSSFPSDCRNSTSSYSMSSGDGSGMKPILYLRSTLSGFIFSMGLEQRCSLSALRILRRRGRYAVDPPLGYLRQVECR